MKKITGIIIPMLLILVIASAELPGQSEFQVEFYKSKGELTKSDLYKRDFGRYKGFEIPVNKGEAGNFVVYSKSFKPSLILTDEKGNVIKQSPGRDANTVLLSSLFPSSGNYVLFIVADSSARGAYEFQYGFASESSFSLAPGSGFKKGIHYLLEHAKAYFLFFENPIEGKESFYKLDGASEVRIDADGSYNALFHKGDDLNAAQLVFSETSSKVGSSFDAGWKRENSEWKQNGDVKEKFVLFKERTNDEPRSVKISLFDFSKARDKYPFNYGVSLIISKEH